MKEKTTYFIDVSSHNGYDITGILADMGTQNTIIKVSESTNYLNPCLSAQVEQQTQSGSIILHGSAETWKKLSEKHATSLIMCLKK